jgi:ABC-type oligopeptide transport system ATPase subunit
MHHGRIVESGSTIDVFRHPQHPFTRRLLAAVDLWVDSGVDEETEAAS